MGLTTWSARRFGKKLARTVVRGAKKQKVDSIGIDENCVIFFVKNNEIVTTIWTLSIYLDEEEIRENDGELSAEDAKLRAETQMLCNTVIDSFFAEFNKKCGAYINVEGKKVWNIT